MIVLQKQRSYNVTFGVQAPSWLGNMRESPHLVHN